MKPTPGAARRFARGYGVTLVLKGANTVIAGENAASLFVNRTGNPGMAQGGSGDLSLWNIIVSYKNNRATFFLIDRDE